jgi:hypothetical protein
MAAVVMARRLNTKIPREYAFIGHVLADGRVCSHAAGSSKNFDIKPQSIRRLYDAGVRRLVVAGDAHPVVDKILRRLRLPNFVAIGIGSVPQLLRVFEIILQVE